MAAKITESDAVTQASNIISDLQQAIADDEEELAQIQATPPPKPAPTAST